MSVVREAIDNLNSVITVTLTPADYEPKLKSELAKYRNKVQLKGFRKGKTPISTIKKMYGKGIIVEVINEELGKQMEDFLKEEDLSVLGQPIPCEGEEQVDFDINAPKEYTFKFDIGLAPDFEVQGASSDTSYERYAVDVDEKVLTKELDAGRERVGKNVLVDDEIQEEDIVAFNAEELDGDKIKENGWATTFSVAVPDMVDEDFKKELATKKKGDKVRFNVFKLEKDKDAEFVRKYLLMVTDNDKDVEIGENFEATIESVTRKGLADLDEEFYKAYFGEGKASNEKEAKALIEKDILAFYDKQADALMFRDIQKALLEKNELELPNVFLKRWLKLTNENINDEQIEEEYESFTKDLRWSLIRGKLTKKYDIKVEEEEIFERVKENIKGIYGNYIDELIVLNTANRMMEDRNYVNRTYQEILADRLFAAIKNVVTVSDKKITSEKFDEILEEVRKESQPPVPEDANKENEETEEVAENVEEV